MTEAQTRRLASLSNCFTSYEIAFHGIDGHKVLCGYSQRKTRACIAKMLVAMRDAVLPLIDETDADWDRPRLHIAYVVIRLYGPHGAAMHHGR